MRKKTNLDFSITASVTTDVFLSADFGMYFMCWISNFTLFSFYQIDIDPYGSPSAFLDSAIQSIADGGLLMCSATDMPVLCGGHTAACYSR